VGDAMIGIVSGGLSLALEATASAATAILGGGRWPRALDSPRSSTTRTMSFGTPGIF
jgi:hypothetical protein